MLKLINLFLSPYRKYKEHKACKRRITEVRKRDPFIYK